MVEWAGNYHSCYKDENVTDVNGREVKSEYEHYTYCPDGSEYVPVMEGWVREHGVQRTGFRYRGEGGVEG